MKKETKELEGKIKDLVPDAICVLGQGPVYAPAECNQGKWNRYGFISCDHDLLAFIIWTRGNHPDVISPKMKALMRSEGYTSFYYDPHMNGYCTYVENYSGFENI